MNVTDLSERISRWEDLHTEFKEKLVRQATDRDIGIDIRDFEVLLTIPRMAHGSRQEG